MDIKLFHKCLCPACRPKKHISIIVLEVGRSCVMTLAFTLVETLNEQSWFIRAACCDSWHCFHCQLGSKCGTRLNAFSGFEVRLANFSQCLCLRVQPPSWKLKNPREQRSHLGPPTPGWQRHWPLSSQSNDFEPNELQWHGTHAPLVVMPWVWVWEQHTTTKLKHNDATERQGGKIYSVFQ